MPFTLVTMGNMSPRRRQPTGTALYRDLWEEGRKGTCNFLSDKQKGTASLMSTGYGKAYYTLLNSYGEIDALHRVFAYSTQLFMCT